MVRAGELRRVRSGGESYVHGKLAILGVAVDAAVVQNDYGGIIDLTEVTAEPFEDRWTSVLPTAEKGEGFVAECHLDEPDVAVPVYEPSYDVAGDYLLQPHLEVFQSDFQVADLVATIRADFYDGVGRRAGIHDELSQSCSDPKDYQTIDSVRIDFQENDTLGDSFRLFIGHGALAPVTSSPGDLNS